MKLLFAIMVYILINLDLYGQLQKLEIKKINGWPTILLISDSQTVDTLWRYGYEFEIIDSKLSPNSVSYILISQFQVNYFKFLKFEGKWIYDKTSGVLGPNYNYPASVPTPRILVESRKKREYKIIGDDRVSIKVDGVETIKDCKDFKIEREAREREYQEWIRNRDKTDKDTIK